MNAFISISSTGGCIGRVCWVNSDTCHAQHYGWVEDSAGRVYWINGGWWGSTYLSSPHPSRPGDAW
jgi:hypothetical protein